MKIYVAGSNYYGIDPDSDHSESDRDMMKLCEDLGVSYNRLVSFYYLKEVRTAMELKKESLANENKP